MMALSGKATPRYVVDTSSLIHVKEYYPDDVFRGVWDKLDELATSGVILSSRQVLEELAEGDDEAYKWAKRFGAIFLELENPIQEKAREITDKHSTFVDRKKQGPSADLFVVATAIVLSCAVVTQEVNSRNPDRAKIPDVCRIYNVECIDILDMFRREGLQL